MIFYIETRRVLYGTTKYKASKLTATFRKRDHYVCHFANLQFYLKQGMLLKKVCFRSLYNKIRIYTYISLGTSRVNFSSVELSGGIYQFLYRYESAIKHRLRAKNLEGIS